MHALSRRESQKRTAHARGYHPRHRSEAEDGHDAKASDDIARAPGQREHAVEQATRQKTGEEPGEKHVDRGSTTEQGLERGGPGTGDSAPNASLLDDARGQKPLED
jgi:hypothetical protein